MVASNYDYKKVDAYTVEWANQYAAGKMSCIELQSIGGLLCPRQAGK